MLWNKFAIFIPLTSRHSLIYKLTIYKDFLFVLQIILFTIVIYTLMYPLSNSTQLTSTSYSVQIQNLP